jgi:hypothetical protein
MNQNLKDFYFLSDFLNRRVYTPSGQRMGNISDLIAERAEPYPMIIGLVVRTRGREKSRRVGTTVSVRQPYRLVPSFTCPGRRSFKLSPSLPFPKKSFVPLQHPFLERISFFFGKR